MARSTRVDYPGSWHHVMHRGARQAPIFDNDTSCSSLLAIVGEAAERFDLGFHAYSLMPNHYHFLVQSRQGNLSRAFQLINGRYTQQVNKARGWDGPLFRGRFRSQIISSPEGLRYVMAYIHLNPLRANLITKLDSEGAWTSHLAYLGKQTPQPWLDTSFFIEQFGSSKKLHAGVLDLHRKKTSWPDEMSLTTGWLKQKFEGSVPGSGADVSQGQKVASRPSLTSERAVTRVLQITGTDLEQLLKVQHGRNANPPRRFAVWALHRSTELTYRQIGEHLKMSTQQVANVLSRFDRGHVQLKAWMNAWDESDM